jgi:trans-L-3-hydroxyproline dehydratase
MTLDPRPALGWLPPGDWARVVTVDAHTAGEPLRIVVAGYPELAGDDVLARRRDARDRHDALRRALMWEPRGHADMYGAVLSPPVTPGADVSVLFLHNEGYSSMCGHGVIALATVAVETGMVPADGPAARIGMDTPAGLVVAHARIEEGRVASVAFRNVPSYVVALDATVEVPGLGPVRYDLAFGGAYYAFVDARAAGVQCDTGGLAGLIERGRAIKRAVAEARDVDHPTDPDLGFLYGVVFVDAPRDPGAHSRNVCVFADGEVDRSPTGTGVSARAAIHHARGELALGDSLVVESVIGTRFAVRAVETTRFGPYDAVVPEVEGQAFITGRHEFLVDPRDPLGEGVLLR